MAARLPHPLSENENGVKKMSNAKEKVIKFRHYKCVMKTAHYHNGNNALQFIDADNGEPILTASINPGIEIPPHLLAVKDYSENVGVAKCLADNGIIGKRVAVIPSGWIEIGVYQLTDEGKELFA